MLSLWLLVLVAAALVALLWIAWRALRQADLRALAGWSPPPLAAKVAYGAALLLLALYSFMNLHRAAGVLASGVPEALATELAKSLLLHGVPLAFAALRLWHLWRDPDALWVPRGWRPWLLLAAALAVVAMLAPFAFHRPAAANVLWTLAPALPLAKLFGVAVVEFPRYLALDSARPQR